MSRLIDADTLCSVIDKAIEIAEKSNDQVTLQLKMRITQGDNTCRQHTRHTFFKRSVIYASYYINYRLINENSSNSIKYKCTQNQYQSFVHNCLTTLYPYKKIHTAPITHMMKYCFGMCSSFPIHHKMMYDIILRLIRHRRFSLRCTCMQYRMYLEILYRGEGFFQLLHPYTLR